MDAQTELEQLKAEFQTFSTDEERLAFKERVMSGFNQKSESEKEAFCRAFEEGAEEAINRADALINYVNVKRNLQEILNIMPISYISETYFKRSRSWLSQRLNGNLVNGLPVSLTPKELKILSDALNDISDKIKTAARSIA